MVTGPRTALAALYTLGTTPGGCQALARVSSLPAALSPQLTVEDAQLATMAAATLGAFARLVVCSRCSSRRYCNTLYVGRASLLRMYPAVALQWHGLSRSSCFFFTRTAREVALVTAQRPAPNPRLCECWF